MATTQGPQIGDDSVNWTKESVLEARTEKDCIIMTMSCDSVVMGALDETDCTLADSTFIDYWDFDGIAGQTVTVDLVSDDFDTYLFLANFDDGFVVQDNDSGTGTNSSITHVLETTGVWTVGANGFGPEDVGSYTVTLDCGSIFLDDFESGDFSAWSSFSGSTR
jgi:hypothetical protein